MTVSGPSRFSQDLRTYTKIPVTRTPTPPGCGQSGSSSGGSFTSVVGCSEVDALSRKPVSAEGPARSLWELPGPSRPVSLTSTGPGH